VDQSAEEETSTQKPSTKAKGAMKVLLFEADRWLTAASYAF
jgi:hypothetical protein